MFQKMAQFISSQRIFLSNSPAAIWKKKKSQPHKNVLRKTLYMYVFFRSFFRLYSIKKYHHQFFTIHHRITAKKWKLILYPHSVIGKDRSLERTCHIMLCWIVIHYRQNFNYIRETVKIIFTRRQRGKNNPDNIFLFSLRRTKDSPNQSFLCHL